MGRQKRKGYIGISQHIQQKINAARIEVISVSDTSITWRVTHSEDMYLHVFDAAGIYNRKEYFNSTDTIEITTNGLNAGYLYRAVLKFTSDNREVKQVTYRTTGTSNLETSDLSRVKSNLYSLGYTNSYSNYDQTVNCFVSEYYDGYYSLKSTYDRLVEEAKTSVLLNWTDHALLGSIKVYTDSTNAQNTINVDASAINKIREFLDSDEGKAVKNTITGLGDTALGTHIFDRLAGRSTVTLYNGGKLFGQGFTLSVTDTLKFNKLAKGFQGTVGVLSSISYGYDLFEDYQDYSGTDFTKAASVDTGSFVISILSGIGAGAAITAGAPAFAVILGGIALGFCVDKLADSIKERWCN